MISLRSASLEFWKKYIVPIFSPVPTAGIVEHEKTPALAHSDINRRQWAERTKLNPVSHDHVRSACRRCDVDWLAG